MSGAAGSEEGGGGVLGSVDSVVDGYGELPSVAQHQHDPWSSPDDRGGGSRLWESGVLGVRRAGCP